MIVRNDHKRPQASPRDGPVLQALSLESIDDAGEEEKPLNMPDQQMLLAEWVPRLKEQDLVYQKSTKMHARRCTCAGTLETVIDGEQETSKGYSVGDYIVEGLPLASESRKTRPLRRWQASQPPAAAADAVDTAPHHPFARRYRGRALHNVCCRL